MMGVGSQGLGRTGFKFMGHISGKTDLNIQEKCKGALWKGMAF